MKTLPKNLLFSLALAVVLISMAVSLFKVEEGADFPEFYAAAKIVAGGSGRQLYSPALQHELQARYAGRMGVYFNHPPFEALFFLPFSGTSVARAYHIWGLLNVFLLAWTARILGGSTFPQWDWRLLLLAFLAFPPVLLNFIQGQDSILLLSCVVFAFATLKADRPALAGALLGFGLFKFHIVLPLVAVIFLSIRKRTSFVRGFLVVAVSAVLISTLISGRNWPVEYGRFLKELPSLPLAGIHPEAMANLRGIATILLPLSEFTRIASVIVFSLALLVLVIRSWRRQNHNPESQLDLVFANGVVASLLVGYHLSPHDLSLLLLPIALTLRHVVVTNCSPPWIRYALWAILAILFLPPLHLLLIKDGLYVFLALPMLVLFLLVQAELDGRRSPGGETLANS